MKFSILLLYLALLCFLICPQIHCHKAIIDDDDDPEPEIIKQEEQFKPKEPEEFKMEIPPQDEEFVPKNPGFNYYAKKYYYEMYGIAFGLFCILFLIRGKSQNDTLALAWKKACMEVIATNFSHFGFSKEPSADLEKISYSEYQFYASGRVNCIYALFKLFLKKRFCVFSSFFEELIKPVKDTLQVEIPIIVPDYTLPDGSVTNLVPLEMIICKRRDMKNILNEMPQKGLIGQLQPKLAINQDQNNPNLAQSEIQSQLVVIGEVEEAVNHIIDNQVSDVLKKMGQSNIQEIHITDQKLFSNTQLVLRAKLTLEDNPDRIKELQRLLKLILHIVDRSVSLRLSASNREKVDKIRKKVEQIKKKEKSDEKEEEKLKKLREEDLKFKEKIKSLPPDQQRKLEEKKYKKDLQKSKSKMQKMVKF